MEIKGKKTISWLLNNPGEVSKKTLGLNWAWCMQMCYAGVKLVGWRPRPSTGKKAYDSLKLVWSTPGWLFYEGIRRCEKLLEDKILKSITVPTRWS